MQRASSDVCPCYHVSNLIQQNNSYRWGKKGRRKLSSVDLAACNTRGDNFYMVYLFILSRDLSTLLQMKGVFCSIVRQVCMKLRFHKEMLIILILP